MCGEIGQTSSKFVGLEIHLRLDSETANELLDARFLQVADEDRKVDDILDKREGVYKAKFYEMKLVKKENKQWQI